MYHVKLIDFSFGICYGIISFLQAVTNQQEGLFTKTNKIQ